MVPFTWHGTDSRSSPFLCVIWVLASRCGFVGVSCRSGGAEHGLFAGDVPEPGDGVGLHEFAVGLLGEDRLVGLCEPVLLDEHGRGHAHGRVGVREHADDAGTAFDLPVEAFEMVVGAHVRAQSRGQLHHAHRGLEPLVQAGCGLLGHVPVVGHDPVLALPRLLEGLTVEHLGEFLADAGLVFLGRLVRDVLGEMELAALPRRAGEHGAHGLPDVLVRVVRDHQRAGHDPVVDAHLQVGRVDREERVRALDGSSPERFDLLVQALARLAGYALGHVPATQLLDHAGDLARGHAHDDHLRHRRHQRGLAT